jgi:hypothetical protein
LTIVLLILESEKFFGEKPIKWVVGHDSVDIGGPYASCQNFTWVEFIFENDMSDKLNELTKKYPDEEIEKN